MSTGSAVLLGTEKRLLTAFHVVSRVTDKKVLKSEQVKIEVLSPEGKKLSDAEVFKADAVNDLAVLQVLNKAVLTSEESEDLILASKVKTGEQVFAMGFPLKETMVITEGIVNAAQAKVNGKRSLLMSAQVVSGMSGGPVFNERAELVGIISGSFRTMNGIHLVSDRTALAALLK